MPGSPKAVRENLGFIEKAIPHAIELINSKVTDCGSTAWVLFFLERDLEDIIHAFFQNSSFFQTGFRQVFDGDAVDIAFGTFTQLGLNENTSFFINAPAGNYTNPTLIYSGNSFFNPSEFWLGEKIIVNQDDVMLKVFGNESSDQSPHFEMGLNDSFTIFCQILDRDGNYLVDFQSTTQSDIELWSITNGQWSSYQHNILHILPVRL